MVETKRADEPLRTGEFPPTLVWATDEAAAALSQVGSPEATLDERVDELEKRVKKRGDTYVEMKRRLVQHDQHIEDVEEQVAELEQELNDLIGRVTRLADVVEEIEEQPEVSDADFVFE